jgi:hypothetical protein
MTRTPPTRALVALAVALLLSFPTQGAQTAVPAGLLGRWAGSAKLTNEWGASPCSYAGGETPPAVTLEIESKGDGDGVEITATIDLAGTPGAPCPPVHKRYTMTSAQITDSTISFRDPAGHEWNLGLRGDRLQGLVGWRSGGDEILAEGFTGPSGERPLARLSGEVSFARVGAPDTSTAPPAASAEAKAGGGTGTATAAAGGAAKGDSKKAEKAGGKGLGLLPSILAANIIGLGAFYGVKAATDDSGKNTGQASCSPRECFYSGIDDPCICPTGNLASGFPCGNAPGGVPFQGACKLPNKPCQASLSCNNGVCDDSRGRCPF